MGMSGGGAPKII
jgi:hypothetical protein